MERVKDLERKNFLEFYGGVKSFNISNFIFLIQIKNGSITLMMNIFLKIRSNPKNNESRKVEFSI